MTTLLGFCLLTVGQNRIILAVSAVFGVFFVAGGVVSLFRHLG